MDSSRRRISKCVSSSLGGSRLRQVIMATNRIDILDSALLRPGRIDRKIEFPPPNPEARITILKIHSRKVSRSISQSPSLLIVRCRCNGESTSDRWQRRWVTVPEPKSAVSVPRLVSRCLYNSTDPLTPRYVRAERETAVCRTGRLRDGRCQGTEEERRGQHECQQALQLSGA